MEKKLYLLRHCRPVLPGSGHWCIGQTDLALSPEGSNDAYHLQEYFKHKGITAIFASDLARSVQTAQIIGDGLGLKPQVTPELREIKMGQWDGLSFVEIKERFPEAYRLRGENLADYVVPGGESFRQCAQRVKKILTQIMTEAVGHVLVVAHAGVNRAFLWDLAGGASQDILSRPQDYGWINCLIYDDQRQGWTESPDESTKRCIKN